MIKLKIIILMAFIFFTAAVSDAEKFYKDKDDRTRHFSDTPSDTDQTLKFQQVHVEERKKRLKVQRRGTKNQPVFYVINEYCGPVEIEFTFTKMENIVSDPVLPARFLIPGSDEMKAFTLKPSNPDKLWSYRYKYRFALGDPKAVHRPLKPYRVPFESGNSYRISQAFNGKFSHNIYHSRHAVDFPMPEGTKICAARDGVIMDIANDFFTGGSEMAVYGERANLVRILHDDGTMAVYAHLKQESVRFPLGTRVSEGQVIAESGNTGFSTGPHLHFVIQRNTGMKLMSVPFKFKGEHGKEITPVEDMVIKADD